MRRLLLHIIIFLLPLFLLLLLIPIPVEQFYAGLQNDCAGRGDWLYHRLYEDERPVDIAFIGSSKTMNGIDEKIIEEQHPDWHVLNYGYCRYGRNLHFAFINNLVMQKDPKQIVLEVRAFENPYSHPVAPYVSSPSELFRSYPLLNKDWVNDWSVAVRYRVQLVQENLWQNIDSIKTDTNNYGYMFNPNQADSLELYREKEKRKSTYENSFKRSVENVYPRHYLNRITRLCEQNNIQLTFLYLPNYGAPGRPSEENFYRKSGKLIIPPGNILSDPKNWSDPNHLNREGAIELSRWLAEELSSR